MLLFSDHSSFVAALLIYLQASVPCSEHGAIMTWGHMQGLWRGTTPALGLTVPYCAVQFAVLNQCKALAASQGWNDSKWASAVSFGSGSAAGAAATFVSYPFDLLRTVLASQGQPPLYRGMIDAAQGILKQSGPRGLFTGVNITLLEIIPYAGIQFGTYDILNRTSEKFLSNHGVTDRSPQLAFSRQFLVGFLAGLISKVRPAPPPCSATLHCHPGLCSSAHCSPSHCSSAHYYVGFITVKAVCM